jgi:hypothetical protein
VRGVSSGVRSIRRSVRRQPIIRQQLHSQLAVPSVFTSRVGPVSFSPFQRAATSAVESAVHALPGRVRAPIFPQTPGVRTAAQQNLINLATTRYVHRAAAERGYQARGQGLAPLQRSLMRSDPQARQALNTYFRGGTAGSIAARDFRRQTMQVARRQGINAAVGGRSVDYGPPGVRGWNSDPRALQALRVALAGGNQAVQARLGNVANAQAKVARTTPADAPYLRHIADKNSQGPISRAGGFLFGPQHNAFAAVTSGLYKNSSAFRDVVNLPVNTVSTGYNLGAGVFEKYFKGDPRRIRNIEAGLKRHDPVVLAVRSLIEGNPKLLKRAGFEARTHPASTLLELSGVGHGLARAAEVGGRLGVPRTLRQDVNAVAARGPRLRMGAQMARGVATFDPGTGLRGRRPFSRHAAVRVAQRARAERRAADAKRLRGQASRMFTDARGALSRGDAATFDTLTRLSRDTFAKANRVDPRHMTPDEVRRFVHEHHSAVEGVRRHGRGQAIRAARAATHPDHGAIQSLYMQGIVHLTKSDLRAYRSHLEAQAATLDGARLVANRAVRAHLTKAIEDPKFDPKSIRAYAKAYREAVNPMQHELVKAGMLDAGQAERRVLMPYAIRRMGATHDQHAGLVGPDGLPLSNDAIRAHMADPNRGGGFVHPDELAYLPQTPEARGAVNYFRNWAQRETHHIGSRPFTGEATRQGGLDIHPDTLQAHAANVRGLLDANAGYMDFYRQFGFRPHDERFQGSYSAMQQRARDIEATTGRQLKVVRLKPWGGSEAQLQQLLDHAAELQFDERGNPATPVQDALLRAIDPHGSEGGQFGLVDAAAADSLRGHLKVIDPSTGARMLQVLNQGFRRTVLPLSVRWLTGNVAEGALRTLIHAHFNPVSIISDHALMSRALRQHDAFVDADVKAGRMSATEGDRAKAMVRERTVGGGHMEMQAKTMLHRTTDQFLQSGQTPKLVRYAAALMGAGGRVPPIKAALGFVRWYSDAIMHSVNGRMESHIQMAQAGREARLNLIDRRMPSVSQRAVQDLANGLRGTNAQVELGRMVDRAYGQYSKFSPTTRWLISAYTPFLPWTINAVRFLGRVLPADHPVLTGLIAANVNAQSDWLLATGMKPGQVPTWLLGTYPLAGGAHMPLSRYTPFGVAGELPGSLLNLFAPQVMPLIRGWAGMDFKWQPVRGLNGWQDQFVYGLDQFMQANIPIYGPARGVLNRKEQGVLGKVGGWANPVTPYVQHGAGGGGDNGGVLKGGGSSSGDNGGVLKSLSASLPQILSEAAPALKPLDQLASAAGKNVPTMSGRDFRANPSLLPLGKLAARLGPGTPGSVRSLFRQAPALVGQQVLAKVGQGVVPSSAVLPSVQLRRYARYGVKNSAGAVTMPAGRASAQIKSLSALGYGNGQVVSHLSSGTPLKKLGAPARLVRAMRVLKGVKPPTGQRGITAAAAKKYGVDPKILWGMYGNETAFGTNLNTSSAGAQGYMQFMPGTARSYGVNVRSFKSSMYGAAHYIHDLLSKNGGSYPAALNSYSGGAAGYYQGAVTKGQRFGNVKAMNLTPPQRQALKIAQRAAVAWQNVGSGGGGPVRAGIFADPSHSGRIDMGWDVTGAGPVTAFAPGRITRSTTSSGWPGGGMVTVKLDRPVTTGGKTYRYMFYAENIAPQVRVGQHVRAGQPLAHARGVAPFTEQGFAIDPQGTTAAASYYKEGMVTPDGQRFYNWVHSKAGKAAVNRKGGPRMSQLPAPVRRFLKRYAPVAAAMPGGVSSGGSVSSGGGSTGGGGSSSGGGGVAAGGSSAGLAALIKSLSGGSAPVTSALAAPWFATGPALAQVAPVRRKKSYI